MTERRRYFMMGNALVVGIVGRLGDYIKEIVENETDQCFYPGLRRPASGGVQAARPRSGQGDRRMDPR